MRRRPPFARMNLLKGKVLKGPRMERGVFHAGAAHTPRSCPAGRPLAAAARRRTAAESARQFRGKSNQREASQSSSPRVLGGCSGAKGPGQSEVPRSFAGLHHAYTHGARDIKAARNTRAWHASAASLMPSALYGQTASISLCRRYSAH